MTDSNLSNAIKNLNCEVVDSVNDVLNKRLTSPIYGVFLISWVAFHWNFVYTMFFVSENKIWDVTKKLKNVYLQETYFNFKDWSFYLFWFLPFLITYVVIWWFPKFISLPAYSKEEEYKTEKKKIKLRELSKLRNLENKVEKENLAKLDIEKQKSEKEMNLIKLDPSKKWILEYNVFKNSEYFKDFNFILESIYENRGRTGWEDENRVWITIPQGILAYSHSAGIIEIKQDNTINLTNKGKFFVKEYTLTKKKKLEEIPF